jgi:hypothetical protein
VTGNISFPLKWKKLLPPWLRKGILMGGSNWFLSSSKWSRDQEMKKIPRTIALKWRMKSKRSLSSLGSYFLTVRDQPALQETPPQRQTRWDRTTLSETMMFQTGPAVPSVSLSLVGFLFIVLGLWKVLMSYQPLSCDSRILEWILFERNRMTVIRLVSMNFS